MSLFIVYHCIRFWVSTTKYTSCFLCLFSPLSPFLYISYLLLQAPTLFFFSCLWHMFPTYMLFILALSLQLSWRMPTECHLLVLILYFCTLHIIVWFLVADLYIVRSSSCDLESWMSFWHSRLSISFYFWLGLVFILYLEMMRTFIIVSVFV